MAGWRPVCMASACSLGQVVGGGGWGWIWADGGGVDAVFVVTWSGGRVRHLGRGEF